MAGDLLALIGYVLGACLVLVALLALSARVRCSAPTRRPPFRGCTRRVTGLFGSCRVHGRRPSVRVIHTLGGERLLSRRVCDRCGRSRVFARLRDTGLPFLGCVGFPNCRNPRMLKDYRF